MRKHHPENERTKRRYVEFLKHARRLSESSVDQVAAAIADFEASTGHRDFRQFRIEWAQKYKRQLDERLNAKTGKPLANWMQRPTRMRSTRRPSPRSWRC